MGLTMSTLQPVGAAMSRLGAVTADDAELLRTTQKSMASKVLAAMALERVTGAKADPGRLAERD